MYVAVLKQLKLTSSDKTFPESDLVLKSMFICFVIPAAESMDPAECSDLFPPDPELPVLVLDPIECPVPPAEPKPALDECLPPEPAPLLKLLLPRLLSPCPPMDPRMLRS